MSPGLQALRPQTSSIAPGEHVLASSATRQRFLRLTHALVKVRVAGIGDASEHEDAVLPPAGALLPNTCPAVDLCHF